MTKSLKLIKVPGVSCCVQNNCNNNEKKNLRQCIVKLLKKVNF